MFIQGATFIPDSRVSNDAKHRWRSDRLDGAVVTCCLGTPGQTKVSRDCQREATHEICCLAAEYA